MIANAEAALSVSSDYKNGTLKVLCQPVRMEQDILNVRDQMFGFVRHQDLSLHSLGSAN